MSDTDMVWEEFDYEPEEKPTSSTVERQLVDLAPERPVEQQLVDLTPERPVATFNADDYFGPVILAKLRSESGCRMCSG